MIVHRLRQLARLRAQISWQHAGLAALYALLGTLFVVAFVDVRVSLPWVVRIAVLAGAVMVAAFLLRRRAPEMTARETARLVEQQHPELGQSVRTAAQVAQSLDSAPLPIETELVERTGQRMAPFPLDAELGSRHRLIPLACGTVLLVLCWLAALWLSSEWRTAAARALGLPITFTRVVASASPDWVMPDGQVLLEARTTGRFAPRVVAHIRPEGSGENWRELEMGLTKDGQFQLVLPKVSQALEYYVTGGDGRSETSKVAVRFLPRLQKIVARLDYPAYLGLASEEQAHGDVEAVEGTKVDLDLRFDRPVSQAQVQFSDGTKNNLPLDGLRGHLSTILAAKDLTWKVIGHDTAGAAFETPPHRLKGLVDLPPVIKLAEPRNDVEVTALQELIARVQARDDHGLATVGIVLQVGTKEETLLEKRFEAPDVRQSLEMVTAFLEKYALTLNDSLLVYAYATDHKPRQGARVVSPLAAVDIREFQRLWRQSTADSKECQCQNLLEKIIAMERRIYSDTTQLKELSGNQEVPKTLILPLATKQQEALNTQAELQALLDSMLDPEMKEMQETSRLIVQSMDQVITSLQTLDLAKAWTGEKTALTDLLTLRRQMIYKLGKKNPNSRMADKKPPRQEGERPSLTKLAEQLENAAKEEQAVKAQSKDLAPSAETPAALTRQHEAATGDVAEVLSELDTHPGATTATQERGAQTEKLMNAAGQALQAERAQAGEALGRSEAALRELATHLRLLDRSPDEAALAQLEQRAEKAAECLSECAKCARGGSPKPGSSPGQGQSQEADAKGFSKTGRSGAAEGHGDKPADFAPKVQALSEQARTLDDALRRWSGGGDDSQPAKHPGLGRAAGDNHTDQWGKELDALAWQLATLGQAPAPTDGAKPGTASKDAAASAEKATQSPGPSPGTPNPEDLAAQADEMAHRHHEIAATLRREREALRQTRAQQLAALRERLQKVAGDNFTAPPAAKNAPLEPSPTVRNALGPNLAGEPAQRLIDDLRASGDPDLTQWADAIDSYRKRPVLAWRALRLADMRLATLLTDLKRVAPVAVRESTVPDAYRRLVENYFRALSDDFGDEANETAAPAK